MDVMDVFDVIKYKSYSDLSVDELQEVTLLCEDETAFQKMKNVLLGIESVSDEKETLNDDLFESLVDLQDDVLLYKKKRKRRTIILSLSAAAVFVMVLVLPVQFDRLQKDADYVNDDLYIDTVVDAIVPDSTVSKTNSWD